jgi:hypothetical protein
MEGGVFLQALREVVPVLVSLASISGPDVAQQLGRLAAKAEKLAAEVDAAIRKHGVIEHGGGTILAYEVDGFGNAYVMDDVSHASRIIIIASFRHLDEHRQLSMSRCLSACLCSSSQCPPAGVSTRVRTRVTA